MGPGADALTSSNVASCAGLCAQSRMFHHGHRAERRLRQRHRRFAVGTDIDVREICHGTNIRQRPCVAMLVLISAAVAGPFEDAVDAFLRGDGTTAECPRNWDD